MSAHERDFATFTLEDNVYELGNGVIPRVAEAVGYELTPTPEAANLGDLIGAIAPDKELQHNIPLASRLLKDNSELAADWVEDSGILRPVERTFASGELAPASADAVVISGGISRWMLRRTMVAIGLDPDTYGGEVVGVFGERIAKPGEHQLAARYLKENGVAATEAQFAERFMRSMIENAGFRFDLLAAPTEDGDAVMDYLFSERPDLLEKRVLVAANAPSAVQTTGQFRAAGLRANPDYDSSGNQVYMKSDAISVARRGEKPETHQNYLTGLGQLPRNALYIVRNQPFQPAV